MTSIHTPTHRETPTQVEQNYTMIHEIQYLPFKCDQEEIVKLQETDPYYAKLIQNMKLRNEISILQFRSPWTTV